MVVLTLPKLTSKFQALLLILLFGLVISIGPAFAAENGVLNRRSEGRCTISLVIPERLFVNTASIAENLKLSPQKTLISKQSIDKIFQTNDSSVQVTVREIKQYQLFQVSKKQNLPKNNNSDEEVKVLVVEPQA